jgi:hypothetical protein
MHGDGVCRNDLRCEDLGVNGLYFDGWRGWRIIRSGGCPRQQQCRVQGERKNNGWPDHERPF